MRLLKNLLFIIMLMAIIVGCAKDDNEPVAEEPQIVVPSEAEQFRRYQKKMAELTPVQDPVQKEEDSVTQDEQDAEEQKKEYRIPTIDREIIISRPQKEKKVYRIYLDPGHGGDAEGETEYNGLLIYRNASGKATGEYPANSLGTTTGTSGGGISECDVVYELAEIVKQLLEDNGYEVTLSRANVHTAKAGGGTAIGNWERGRIATGYDAWIVLHADSGGAKGFHCVSYDNDPNFSNLLSDSFLYYMEHEKGRNIYTAAGYRPGYSGNSSEILQAPSKYIENGGNLDRLMYIEAGFMDNKEDLEYILSHEGKRDIADGILYALNTVLPQN